MSSKKKSTKKNARKKSSEKKEVCEVFDIEKEGKDKIVKSCGPLEEKRASKKEIKKQNKLLRNVLIGIGIFILLFIGLIFWIDSVRNFEYKGVEFEVVKEGNLILYKTMLPVSYQGEIRPYNFYLRKDPRKISESVEFDGKVRLLKNMVVNISDINCDGDEVIAIANLAKLYDVLGADVIKDPNASCDTEGRYTYLSIYEGNATKIIEKSEACYDIEIRNCEVLNALERFMVETFVEVNKIGG